MYIKLSKSPTAKNTKVYLVEAYRDENRKPRHRIVKSYGDLEELQKSEPNILDRLKKEAKEMELNQTEFSINLKAKNIQQEKSKNYGYFFLESLYEQLGISECIRENTCNSKMKYDVNEVLKLLVYSRILNPNSKMGTHAYQNEFFTEFKLTLPSIYRSLPILNELKDGIQQSIHNEIIKHYERDCSLVFYDVTNYYFESDIEDDFKRVGVSKENRKSPIVQMGLFIDSNGIPISYKLFSGNTSDTKTLIPIVTEMRNKFNMNRIILTADKGLNSGNNLKYLKENGDGYIVSQKIRGAGKEFIGQVLDEEGYRYNEGETFKIKSFLRERQVKDDAGKVFELKEKVVCFWSKDYEIREQHKREILEEKLQAFIDNPSKYKATNSFGMKKYLKVSHVNTQTGELEKENIHLEMDTVKYERDKALDGYYALVTSEIELSEEAIIEKYRGLWKIEESFKVLKSELEGRPVYVRKQDSIEGHFLVCFISLVLMRILEFKLKKKYSAAKIQSSLINSRCKMVKKGLYLVELQDDIFRELEKAFKIEFDRSYAKLEELRQLRKKIIEKTTKI